MSASTEAFIRDVVRRAQEIAEVTSKAKRKTIDTEHIMQALEAAGASHICQLAREASNEEQEKEATKVFQFVFRVVFAVIGALLKSATVSLDRRKARRNARRS